VSTDHGASEKDRDVSRTEIRARCAHLTLRERQVMEMIIAGLKSKEMAERLGISARTIEVHRSHLMLKMGTKSVPQLVKWTLIAGL